MSDSDQRRAARQVRLLDQADDLKLLGAGKSHASSPPIRDHAFFEQAQFEGLFGNDLFQVLGLAFEILHLIGATMSQKSSLPQAAKSVSQVLMSDRAAAKSDAA